MQGEHDFYVLPAGGSDDTTYIADQHGVTAVLAHNCDPAVPASDRTRRAGPRTCGTPTSSWASDAWDATFALVGHPRAGAAVAGRRRGGAQSRVPGERLGRVPLGPPALRGRSGRLATTRFWGVPLPRLAILTMSKGSWLRVAGARSRWKRQRLIRERTGSIAGWMRVALGNSGGEGREARRA